MPLQLEWSVGVSGCEDFSSALHAGPPGVVKGRQTAWREDKTFSLQRSQHNPGAKSWLWKA